MRLRVNDSLVRTPSRLRPLRVALTVAVICLALRAVISFAIVPTWEKNAGIGPFPDAYPALASTLLQQGQLGFGEIGATPTTTRGPGFPAWLALGMLAGGQSSGWLGFWTGLPGVAVAALIAAWLARRYTGFSGLIGGLAAGLYPLSLLASARTMSDEIYGAFGFAALAAAMMAFGERSSRNSLGWAAIAGTLMACHLLIRSSGLLTLVALGFVVVLFLRPVRPRLLAVLLVVSLVPALAWSVRTSRLEGRPVFVQSLTWYNFWLGESFWRFGLDRVPGEHHNERMNLIMDKAGLTGEARDSFFWRELTPHESARAELNLQHSALQYVRESPLDYAWRFANGLYGFWCVAESPRRTVQYGLLALPVLLLGAWGAICLWRGRYAPDQLGRVVFLTIVLHNLAYAGIKGMARHSAQVALALGYLVGIAIADLTHRFGVERSTPSAGE